MMGAEQAEVLLGADGAVCWAGVRFSVNLKGYVLIRFETMGFGLMEKRSHQPVSSYSHILCSVNS